MSAENFFFFGSCGTSDRSASVKGWFGDANIASVAQRCGQIHDGNPVSDMGNYPEIVADNQISPVELLAQFNKQIDDLGLDRDIEGGRRLVAYQLGWIDRQRTRNADTRTLPTGELVRVTPHDGSVESHTAKKIRDVCFFLLGRDYSVYAPCMNGGTSSTVPTAAMRKLTSAIASASGFGSSMVRMRAPRNTIFCSRRKRQAP